MARIRRIEDDEVFDAAERVVIRMGMAGLSIDAVAKEAGISKARVLYDFKSKAALLEALIDRRLNADRRHTREAVEASSDTAHPELFGRIEAARPAFGHADRVIMLAVNAALSSRAELRNRFREWSREDLDAVVGNCCRSRAALMAYLALLGFYCTELFDFHRWDQAERLRILDEIQTVFLSFPEPA